MTMKFRVLISLLLLTAFAVVASASEFIIPEPSKFYINDYTHTLDQKSISEINNNLENYERETSNQIVVAVFSSLDGNSIEDISIKFSTKWKIGIKGKSNGVLFIVFIRDHEARLEVGYGLESVLTDVISYKIIREAAPYFKNNNYEKGIVNTISELQRYIAGEYRNNTGQIQSESRTNSESVRSILTLFLVFIGFVSIFISYLYIQYRAYWNSNKDAIGFFAWVNLTLSSYSSTGLGYDNDDDDGFRGGGSSGSGGGFSGGGGGFGGGGASGKW